MELKTSLCEYEKAFGQMISLTKSSVMFTPIVDMDCRTGLCNVLGVEEVDNHGTYLGMPSVIDREKIQVFQYVVEKVSKCLKRWKSKLLSTAGKDVLLRMITQVMLNYIMSIFLLPIDTCRELEITMNRFFWKFGNRNGLGLRWMQWARIAIPKIHGGLGYRDIH